MGCLSAEFVGSHCGLCVSGVKSYIPRGTGAQWPSSL